MQTQISLFDEIELEENRTHVRLLRQYKSARRVSRDTVRLPRVSQKSDYRLRLEAALGNPAEWEYRGECWRLPFCGGRCACGHVGLRFQFRIHHPDGRTAIVGSTCINQFPNVGGLDRLNRDAKNLAQEGKKQ